MGYRHPKNLRDILVNANIPRKPGDNEVDLNYVEPIPVAEAAQVQICIAPQKQKSILDYFRKKERTAGPNIGPSTETANKRDASPTPSSSRLGTAPSKRGHKYCSLKNCRYCPRLNKSGEIVSNTTGNSYKCMSNISCRSSNLIYCITCTRCGMQYVGQTSLRLKDRFVHHFYSIEQSNLNLVVGRHFNENGHNGLFDVEISVLEYIFRPPKSPASVPIRNKIEC